MNDNKSPSKLLYSGAAITAIITIIILWMFPILTNHFELKITDLKFSMRSYMEKDPELNSDIVLIALDDDSKIASGYEYIWPYKYISETVKKITDGDPNSFGMDYIFSGSTDTIGWSRFVDELAVSYMAVNPYTVEFGSIKDPFEINLHNSEIADELTMDNLRQIGPIEGKHVTNIRYKTNSALMEVSSGLGFVNMVRDLDGVVRRLPIVAEINGMLAPHFSLKLLCEHLGYKISNIELESQHKLILHKFPVDDTLKTLEIPLDGDGNVLINYPSFEKIQYQMKSGQFTSISAWNLIQHRKAPNFKGKTVIFGDHSLAARDNSITPMDGSLFNPLIFTIVMSNILNEDFLKPTTAITTMYQIILLLILLMICSMRTKAFEFGLISIGTMMLYICINIGLFIYFNLQVSLLSVFIPILAASAYLMIYSLYQSQVTMGILEGSLSSLVSPHLMEQIKNNPDILKLGGERKRISVLFSDIVGFTSFTDRADPAEVQIVLEEYFADMAAIVFDNNGIVDKYMGDGILAFFENPKDGVTSAQASVKTAVEMKKKADLLDKKYKDEKRFPFAICVGIATGYAKVGNIGPPEKVDYTIIGTVVNLASRLDGPGDPGDIVMDEDTYHFVKDDYEIEDFGTHQLKGFEKKIQAYRLK